MAIPPIAPYQIPVGPFPARVEWTLQPERAALLIHDMQRYFIDAYRLDHEPMATALPNMIAIREACSAAGVPVVYTAQPGDQHPSRRGILSDFWGKGLSSGRDEEIIEQLTPRDGDICVTKWRYSGFQRTDLRQLLAHHGRDQLIIVGVYAHMGCMISATDAFMSDVAPFFVVDAMGDFSRDEHRMAAEYIGKRAGRVVRAAQVLRAVQVAATEHASDGVGTDRSGVTA
ncbi:MAG TPA: 2,3-dihydro-2,3-dihydroxybenzoate synthetase [Gordonia polyisoprenivorans]|uniref:isochorismatase family protein n=1 Tax=Gordonia TaxID=2053 RepID=UPI0003669A32|nr:MULTISPECIES: isochorismatase family protein [Gordonia]MBE7191504.1 isochorismatase family protein [Gordonia polyisoprenivorans]MDF3281857.1 isochorismatase family protein [Gordonia sp. N1V]OPX15390.1 2,3-dihydro-2,3-dihydroxybenzoate synthetase [Gordonia sp. i37]OZC30489.1 2,3-dihydro-2,3-dihydroxybenzoate synthetase [Gordonia polyisoprenivorans]QUD85118.1 isochorismatase family protein [Gordonia polyisoprenivorans]